MVTSFGPIVLAAVIATVFGLLPLTISALLVPRHPDRVKNAPYECGVETIGPTAIQFKNQFSPAKSNLFSTLCRMAASVIVGPSPHPGFRLLQNPGARRQHAFPGQSAEPV